MDVESYIAVSPKMLEELDFSQSPLREDFLAEHVGDLFDRDTLAGLVVCGGTEVSD